METEKKIESTVTNFLITKEHKYLRSHGKHINVEMYQAIRHFFPNRFSLRKIAY